MIFCQLWVKNHGVIIDITNNFFTFLSSHFIYIKVFFIIIFHQFILSIKTVIIKIEKDITIQVIIRRGLIKK